MTGKIQKGLVYLKNRGIREFTARAAEKLADARFDYNRWVRAQEPSPLEMGYQKSLRIGSMPKIRVMILQQEGEPVRGKAFRRTEETLRRQTYLNAELCDALTTQVSDEDLIVFVRAGDLLPPHALFELARAILDGSSCVYSDEDRYRLAKDGEREKLMLSDPLFKPDFDPDYLRSVPYIGSLFGVKAGILRRAAHILRGAAGMPAAELADPAVYYEMTLLCTELSREHVAHVPKILCHAAGRKEKIVLSQSDAGGKPQDEEAMRRQENQVRDEAFIQVLRRDLSRKGEAGIVERGRGPLCFHIRYLHPESPLVSLVIPNKDHASMLKRCLDSVCSLTTWERLEIIIVENNSSEPETFSFYDTLKEGMYRQMPVRVVRYREKGFHFSAIINEGVREAAGDYVVLMNNDVTVKTPDWIERLLSQCMREKVGAVGPKLLYPDGTVQSAGIVIGIMGFAGSMMVDGKNEDPGYMNRAAAVSRMSAVTAACMMVSREAFWRAGGFSMEFPVALNDVDFCLRLGEAGYHVLFEPTAELYHHESASRGYENSREKSKRFENEKRHFRKKWEKTLKEGDPHYNPNLSLRTCHYEINAGVPKWLICG
jgi:GT2 family glycosyltransferase